MKPNLYSKRLLRSLEDFVQKMQILDLADEPKLVAQMAVRWTKGQPLLTKSLLELLLASRAKIARGQEAIIVEKIIRNRLIKDFKQDNLTLGIRKLLYAKDFVRLLTKTGGTISPREQIYLQKLQHELGLSQQQENSIREQYLSVSHRLDNNALSVKSFPEFAPDNRYIAPSDSYQDLIQLIETSPVYSQLATVNSSASTTPRRTFNPFKIFKSPSLWLILAVPLLLLSVKKFSKQPEVQTVAATDAKDTAAFCGVNPVSVHSSRLSLGEKLLTNNRKYNYLNPDSKILLYQAITAFASCEYAPAQQKFEQALSISRNNPEALIYLNNTKAIAQEHLKIAVSVPLGSKPAVAWEILRGVAQAQRELNQQGGINGKPLLILIVNDDNDPELARELARQLAAEPQILAVVGHNNSNTSLAVADIYQKQGLVMISPTSSSTQLTGIGSYIMRTTPSVALLAHTLASYALISSYNKIVICVDSADAASISFTEEFTTDLNDHGDKIAAVSCDFAQENFNPVSVMEAAIAQEADALLLATSVNRIDQSISLAQANQNRLPLLGSHSFYTYETIEIGQAAVAEMVLAVPWLPEIDTRGKFTEKASKLWGGLVNWRTAMSYDAAQAIIQGLKQADSRQQLQEILTSSDFSVNGATGLFQFQQGDRLGQVSLAYVGKSAQNSNNYQFLRLKINHNQE